MQEEAKWALRDAVLAALRESGPSVVAEIAFAVFGPDPRYPHWGVNAHRGGSSTYNRVRARLGELEMAGEVVRYRRTGPYGSDLWEMSLPTEDMSAFEEALADTS